MRAFLLAGLIATAFATAAHARDNATDENAMAGQTFVEAGGGIGETHAGRFEFVNPVGAQFIATFPATIPGVSKVSGNDIILDSQRRDASSPTAEASIGHFFSDRIYLRATYRYLGRTHFSGSAAFPIDPSIPAALGFDQDYYMKAHAAYLGMGYQAPLTGALFVDLSAEAGVAWQDSLSHQGANIGDPLGHPRLTRSNFSAGGAIGLGVHLAARYDLIFKARADELGTANTGVAKDMVSADGNWGINAGEQLKLHHLTNYGLGLAIRARF